MHDPNGKQRPAPGTTPAQPDDTERGPDEPILDRDPGPARPPDDTDRNHPDDPVLDREPGPPPAEQPPAWPDADTSSL